MNLYFLIKDGTDSCIILDTDIPQTCNPQTSVLFYIPQTSVLFYTTVPGNPSFALSLKLYENCFVCRCFSFNRGITIKKLFLN